MKILITGAAGNLGTRMRHLLQHVYQIRASDLRAPDRPTPGEEFIAAELADLAQVERAVEGVEGILHLGGLPVEHPWEEILQSNIVGNYNLFEAARRHGVKRVVFASSNQAIGFYRRERRLGADVTVRPSSRYGLSKAFGEAVGALYADKHALRVLCIRIGRVHDYPEDVRRLALWLHPEDLAQLVRIGLEHPALHYEIVYGISDNERSWYDNERARALGYRPTWRAEDFAAKAVELQRGITPNPVADRFMGARHTAMEYDGDLDRSGT